MTGTANNPSASGTFPTTAWSIVRQARSPEDSEAIAAVNRLICGYWKPVFHFLKRKGYRQEAAEDLTQSFFLRFLERNWVERADAARGRFRSYLLSILVRFLSDQSPGRAGKQLSFEQRLVPISTLVRRDSEDLEPSHSQTPEEVFMRQWARSVVGTVVRRLRVECEELGRPDWFEYFSAVHFPAPGSKRASQEQLAERFSVTRDQVRYGLERTHHQFVKMLREEVADQVGHSSDIEREIRDLEQLLQS